MSAIVPFAFEGAQVRVIIRDGEPWFVLADVCRVLEHSNASVAASRLDADEKGVANVYTPGGDQEMTVISESGLYSLILTSRKAEAKRFRKWVTGTVLPSIRKTGSYTAAPPLTREEQLAVAVLLAHDTIREKDSRIAALQEDKARLLPAEASLTMLSNAVGSFAIRDAAANLKQPPGELTKFILGRAKLAYRADDNRLHTTAEAVKAGLAEMVLHPVARGGGRFSVMTFCITTKGMVYLANELRRLAHDDARQPTPPGAIH